MTSERESEPGENRSCARKSARAGRERVKPRNRLEKRKSSSMKASFIRNRERNSVRERANELVAHQESVATSTHSVCSTHAACSNLRRFELVHYSSRVFRSIFTINFQNYKSNKRKYTSLDAQFYSKTISGRKCEN